jgi:hypothetical protein
MAVGGPTDRNEPDLGVNSVDEPDSVLFFGHAAASRCRTTGALGAYLVR